MEVIFRQKGDFSKLSGFFERIKEGVNLGCLDKYGRAGVQALMEATPKDTGLTASSWHYEIVQGKGYASLEFHNSNIQNGWAPIAILLQYGHATGTGGWVEGRDYINPALRPVFEQLAAEAWKEVTRA